jgi:AraC-like DNA-binding protein
MLVRDPDRVDVLSDVLSLLEPRSEFVCRSHLTAPWSIGFSRTAAQFHVVERGTCIVQISSGEAVHAVAGDLVVLPRGVPHRISDAPDRRPVPFEKIVGDNGENLARMLRYGGGGTESVIVCGASHLRNPAAVPMMALLPAAIHVPAVRSRRWLRMTTQLLVSEADGRQPGSDLMTSRLLDLLFVQAVRGWLQGLPIAANVGWLGALRDPRVGAALAALHGAPSQPWTLEELAARAGMSRSPFAARFTSLVGEPPLRYLARWRLLLSSRALVSGTASIREVAASVGYEAEAAFSRAFKRQFGLSPSAYRAAPEAVLSKRGSRVRRAKGRARA